ncbi:hypothetical protein ACC724_39485, partial [Rhizobium ruizarguesonis]
FPDELRLDNGRIRIFRRLIDPLNNLLAGLRRKSVDLQSALQPVPDDIREGRTCLIFKAENLSFKEVRLSPQSRVYTLRRS